MPVYIPYYILYYSYSTAPLYYTDYVLNTLPTHTYTTTPYRPIPTFATSVPRNATLVICRRDTQTDQSVRTTIMENGKCATLFCECLNALEECTSLDESISSIPSFFSRYPASVDNSFKNLELRLHALEERGK